jgi:hypothetical protein
MTYRISNIKKILILYFESWDKIQRKNKKKYNIIIGNIRIVSLKNW